MSTIAKQVTDIIERLDEERQKAVLAFAEAVLDEQKKSDVLNWKDRKTLYPNQRINPAEWIIMHYGTANEDGTWDPGDLVQGDISSNDRLLYDAYMSQIRRHPEKNLNLPMIPKPRINDAQEYVEKRRETRRDYYHHNKP